MEERKVSAIADKAAPAAQDTRIREKVSLK